MDYSLSWFTAGMPTPATYMHQIFWFIPNTLDFIVKRLNEPIVLVMIWIVIITWFLFALLDR